MSSNDIPALIRMGREGTINGLDYLKMSPPAFHEACTLWNACRKTMDYAVKAIEFSFLCVELHEVNDNLYFTYKIMSAQQPD